MDKNFDKILIGLMAAAFIALPFLNSSAQASEKGEGLIGSCGCQQRFHRGPRP